MKKSFVIISKGKFLVGYEAMIFFLYNLARVSGVSDGVPSTRAFSDRLFAKNEQKTDF